ncbi:hypothetical protein FA13DRAFT_1589098, partial [Coprinellus micaceus]
ARHHLEAETNSKYDFMIAREKKARDTIEVLQIPETQPPRYTTSTKKMVEIATQHHYSLQMLEHHGMNAEEREENKQEVLSTLETCLMPTQKDKTSGDFMNTEIKRVLKDVPNGKAAGLDGIPVEIWKFFLSKAQEARKKDQPEADIVNILTYLFNDIAKHGVDPNSAFAEGW